MIGTAVCLTLGLLGVQVRAESLPRGGLEYQIQVEPDALDSLKAGYRIESDLDPRLKDVRAFRIIIGNGKPSASKPWHATTGWEPLPSGGHSFLIQIDPTLAGQLHAGDQIEGDLPADVKDIRTFLVSVGTKMLPTGGTGRPAAPNASDTSRPVLPPSSPASLIDRAANTTSTGISPLSGSRPALSPSSGASLNERPASASSTGLPPPPKAGGAGDGESGTPTLGKRLQDLMPKNSSSSSPKGSSSLGNPSRFEAPAGGSSTSGSPSTASSATSFPSAGFPPAGSSAPSPSMTSSTRNPNPPAPGSSSTASPERAPGLFSFGARTPSSYLERPAEERQAGYHEARSNPSTPLDRGPLAQSFRQETAPQAEPARPWSLFVVVLGVLCASLGGNVYFGWMFWEIRIRYQSLLARRWKESRSGEEPLDVSADDLNLST